MMNGVGTLDIYVYILPLPSLHVPPKSFLDFCRSNYMPLPHVYLL